MEIKRKKIEKLKNILLFYHFTQEIFNCGVFLPITNTPKYSTIVLNLVNDTQDFMCIKYKAFLPCKQHPIKYSDLSLFLYLLKKSRDYLPLLAQCST